ncbi:hypothetical protein ABIB07_003524 [Bradyrhizobium sp. RT10b]
MSNRRLYAYTAALFAAIFLALPWLLLGLTRYAEWVGTFR